MKTPKLSHTAWFEFVLNSQILAQQIESSSQSQEVDILNRLLYQIQIFNRSFDFLPPKAQKDAHQRKIDIQTVCLKFATDLAWDIECFLDNIQINLVEDLMEYLLELTNSKEISVESIEQFSEGQFSIKHTTLILWHIWVVMGYLKFQAVRSGVKPKKQLPLPKLAVTVVSGLTNPVTTLTAKNDATATKLNQQLANSVEVLSKLAQRSDVLAFTLPKIDTFNVSTQSEQTFNESEFIILRWSILRAKITFVLLNYYLMTSDYQQVSCLHTSLVDLLQDLPANSELCERLIVTIDPTFLAGVKNVAQAIVGKCSPSNDIISAISRRDYPSAIDIFAKHSDFQFPSSLFFQELQQAGLDEEQKFHLKFFYACRAIFECQAAVFVAHSCGFATPQSGNGELLGKLLDFFATKWQSLNKGQRKCCVDFVENAAILDPILLISISSSSQLISQPDFSDFVHKFAVYFDTNDVDDSDAEMSDSPNDSVLIQTLRNAPLDQLRLAFSIQDIQNALVCIKPESVNEVITMLSPNSNSIPRRIVTALNGVSQLPNASCTLAFAIKGKQLMENQCLNDACLLLKEAQQLAAAMSSKIHNYVSCLYWLCEFKRSKLEFTFIFQSASTLIRSMLEAVDYEMLDSPDMIDLYVVMVAGVLGNPNLYQQLSKCPLQSPIFFMGQIMASLHVCICDNAQKQQDIKAMAKQFYDVIVQLHLSNEIRGDGKPGGHGDHSRGSRQDGSNQGRSGSFRDRASISRGHGVAPGTEPFDDPKWKPHYELRYWWNLYSRMTDAQMLIYLISCYSKIYAGIKSDLVCDVYNPYFNIWPSSVSNKLDTGARSSVGETLYHLLTCFCKLAPRNPLSWRLLGDFQIATSLPGLALSSYCRLFQVASKAFSEEPDSKVVDDSVLRSVIRCFTHTRCPMKVAVVTQFLTSPDYQLAFNAITESWNSSLDSDDALFPFVVDVVLLEFLINFYEIQGCADDKRALLIKVAHQTTPDLNPYNDPNSAQKAVRTAAKLGFFEMCYFEYCCS